MHVALACAWSRKGSDYFSSYVHNFSLHFYKRLFSGLKPMISWSPGQRGYVQGVCIPYPVRTGYGYSPGYVWDMYPEPLFKSGYVYPVHLGQLWIRPNRVFGPFSPCTVYPKPSIRVFLFPVTQLPPLYERMKLPSWRRRLPRLSPLPLSPLGELSTAAASPR
jgi:hypothetical protein